MKRILFTLFDTPFYIFLFFCYLYFIIKNINYLKNVDGVQFMNAIDEFCSKFIKKYSHLSAHISGITWILILLYHTL